MDHTPPAPLSGNASDGEGAVIPLFRQTADRNNSPSPLSVALVGTYAPRKCGIATFTTDLVEQLHIHHPEIGTKVYALDNPQNEGNYAGRVQVVDPNNPQSYCETARLINESAVDAVWLQHEFGIFGGPDGELVCDFVDRLAAPLIVTFHTVLTSPSDNQRRIMRHLITRASRIMVMSQHGHDLLAENYGAPREILQVIAHGAPDRPFGRETEFKAMFGLEGRSVLMTFGLLGPGKGLEQVIEALPAIVARHPDVVYRIVGATHPTLVSRDGESYRESLRALADRLGVADHIQWENRFLDTPELLDQLEACDLYVTPYFNMQQARSGTLSYAVALGKAVVSTPYVHARELLADGVGVLVEPDSCSAIAEAVIGLLDDRAQLDATRRRAYAEGRKTIWPCFAAASAALVRAAASPASHEVPITATPGLSGVFAMSDSTGMLQHAIGIVPDRWHGYCIDDNARALILMNHATGISQSDRSAWSTVFASFIQYAWNPDLGRFRNFMRFDRTWCEDAGSDDSNGRTIWALGDTAAHAPDEQMRKWGRRWFDETLPCMATIDSPRAVAFAMLGSCAVLRTEGKHDGARQSIERGGALLFNLLGAARRPDWAWFEAVLGYDNPRLSQALIEAGSLLGRQDWIGEGLNTLEWIARRQSSATGHFRAVGSETFGREHEQLPFDQQPLEAQAAAEASATAFAATGDAKWIDHALAAYRWFFGANDRGVMLADLATGRCRDGVTPRGANENCGAESILAFQLSHVSVLGLLQATKRTLDTRDIIGRLADQTSQPLANI